MTQIRINIITQGEVIPPVAPVQYYMHKEDRAILGGIRSCAPCPAVWVMKDDPHAVIGQQWQYYIRGINYAMTVDNCYLTLDRALAFANGTGFRISNDPRADWFHNKDLQYAPPNLDKVRTTSRSVLTGTEQFSLVQALEGVRNVLQSFLSGKKTILRDVSNALVSKNVLKVRTFDGTKPPPLKQGRKYPADISEVNPDDYLYLPQFNREMFLVANIVNSAGEVVQFPRGGLYSWTNDNTPYTFMPHISNPTYGDVLYPMDNLIKLPLGSPVPSPYRRN